MMIAVHRHAWWHGFVAGTAFGCIVCASLMRILQ